MRQAAVMGVCFLLRKRCQGGAFRQMLRGLRTAPDSGAKERLNKEPFTAHPLKHTLAFILHKRDKAQEKKKVATEEEK